MTTVKRYVRKKQRELLYAQKVELMAEIEKGQQLAGHFPNREALDRAERILTGKTSFADAKGELRIKYGK